MEQLALPSLIYFLLFLSLLLLSLQFLQKHASNSKLPPGPSTLPIIGNLHHLVTSSLPHRTLRDLALLHGPVMLLRAGGAKLVVISSREAAKEVMQMQDANFANRPTFYAMNVFFYGGTDIAFSNGPHWNQMRRICVSELLSPTQVRSFSSIRREEINSMLKSFSLVSGKTPINLSAVTHELTNNTIFRTSFGKKCEQRDAFIEIFRDITHLMSFFHMSDLFPSLSWFDVKMRARVATVHSKMDFIVEDIIEEQLKNRQQRRERDEEIEYNLVNVLMDVMERDELEMPITIDNIKAIIMDLFIGGTDSSAIIITWAMTELIKHPEAMKRAQTEIRQAASNNTDSDKHTLSYIESVIKETIRLHPPGPLLLPRQCKESCQVLGYTIPSGARVAINAWALGRNPEYWDDPDEFKPERFETSAIDFNGRNFVFLPFGAGRRICPGLKYAVTLMKEALVSMLFHFDWKLPQGMKLEHVDMTELFGLSLSKKEPMYLVPTLRIPLPDD